MNKYPNNTNSTQKNLSSSQMQVWMQHLLPQHLLSKLAGKISNCRHPLIKNSCLQLFNHLYTVDLVEAGQTDIKNYSSFNNFFTRHLRPETRPIDPNPQSIVSPADGTVYQAGILSENSLLRAKGHDFVLDALVGDPALATQFIDGSFVTIYLAPHNYHRVHIPFAGKLKEMRYIPGKLFSVNPKTAEGIPQLFARNERVVCTFNTVIGPMVVILVGALLVGNIHTTWASPVITANREIGYWDYSANAAPIHLSKGQELGHFQMGSTVIVLFPKNTIQWNKDLTPGKTLRYGELIGLSTLE